MIIFKINTVQPHAKWVYTKLKYIRFLFMLSTLLALFFVSFFILTTHCAMCKISHLAAGYVSVVLNFQSLFESYLNINFKDPKLVLLRAFLPALSWHITCHVSQNQEVSHKQEKFNEIPFIWYQNSPLTGPSYLTFSLTDQKSHPVRKARDRHYM